jgi:hypothetical protein
MLNKIFDQLHRLKASEVVVQADEIDSSTIQVAAQGKWCSVGAQGFLRLLASLPDGAGVASVLRALRAAARRNEVWATHP